MSTITTFCAINPLVGGATILSPAESVTDEQSNTFVNLPYGAIQMLRNSVEGGRVLDFPEKSVTKMCCSTLLAL